MSKDEEIKILRAFAARLTGDTYTGRWLNDQLAQIESAIRSDLPPDVRALTCEAAYQEGAAIVERANAEAAAVRAKAEQDALEIRDRALAYQTGVRVQLRESIRAILERC